jgi:hypothetical protein
MRSVNLSGIGYSIGLSRANGLPQNTSRLPASGGNFLKKRHPDMGGTEVALILRQIGVL